MKKKIYTTIRYEGKRLEPGTHDFSKEFVDSANPDIFSPEISKGSVDTSAFEASITELESQIKAQEATISKQEKEIEELNIKIASSGGE